MKLKEFRKLLYKIPTDAEIMLVMDWDEVVDHKLPLITANAIRLDSGEVQFNEDPVYYVIHHDPELDFGEKNTLKEFRKLLRGLEKDVEVFVEDWSCPENGKPNLLSANWIGSQPGENNYETVYFISHDPEVEYQREQKMKKELEKFEYGYY